MALFPEYATFLKMFQDKGYRIKALHAGDLAPQGDLYLRHDIDFDCELALDSAKIEADLGATSTYFFMLSSDSYNPLSAENSRRIKEIRDLGHKISVHFDALCHEDFHAGLTSEVKTFEDFFDTKVDLVSLHRPNDFFLSHDAEIAGISHTYQSKYLKDIKYVADSQGRFRFGDPQDTDAFKDGASIHLLIHPVWWTTPGDTPQAVLDAYTKMRIGRFQDNIEANCKTYKRSDSVVSTEL